MKAACRVMSVLLVSFLIGAAPAGAAEQGGVNVGSLTCKTKPGTSVQLFLVSSVAVECAFKTTGGEEMYKGELGFLGVDLSRKDEQTLNFTVLGVTRDIKMGAHSLQGDYLGTSVAAGMGGKGVGSTALVGGLRKSFNLVPSADTFKGAGISAGATRMNLQPLKK
ncbi:MAG: DUF992 domain-containing protein [Candidatus Tectomicrobia bacterium]|uniref:DUF992 domain-containing protein n=1 Tax=Tectimicrobiota bacterium TaxID=2528274 RepID=A0A932I0U6_UNCTE|nr:DUF992 domain-containing protein [Candidatus Tectomicrobia bacterium]